MKKDWMIKESELDDDQIKVLTATLDKSCVISGCAGSGKSVLPLPMIIKRFGQSKFFTPRIHIMAQSLGVNYYLIIVATFFLNSLSFD